MTRRQIFRLEGELPPGTLRLLTDTVELSGDVKTSWETVTRVTKFKDPFYGTVDITHQKIDSLIRNFSANTFGQDIFVDISHQTAKGAAGKFLSLQHDGSKLRGHVEWTPFGIEAVVNRGYRYFSAEFHENYQDPETGIEHGPTLFGAALTTRPRVKRLDPINPDLLQLSLDGDSAPTVIISPRMQQQLSTEIKALKDKFLKKFTAFLAGGIALSDDLAAAFIAQFEAAINGVTDEGQASALLKTFEESATQLATKLAEGPTPGTIKLDFSGLPDTLTRTAAPGLTAEDVKRLMAEDAEARWLAAQKTQAALDANIQLFTDHIEQQDGLAEDIRRELCADAPNLIVDGMKPEQVQKLAEMQVSMGNKLAAARKLADLGYSTSSPSGSVQITLSGSPDAVKLQDQLLEGLARTSHAAQKKLSLIPEKDLKPFTKDVLRMFDTANAPRLHMEHRALASGEVAIPDTDLPLGFQRTVIREVLEDQRILDIVQTLTDPSAQGTTQIPYEQRDGSQIINNGIVYEGQAIPSAGVSQSMDLAYINPMKLAMNITNEVMHFTRTSQINWDAYARNVDSNSTFIRELVARRITNDLQRSADSYGAVDVTAEAFDTQLTGSASTIKTAQFPLVRPHQQKDMTGANVGAAENPLTVTLNGTALSEYDGSGNQAAGTYYRVTNYNLGYIQFVDEAGAAQTPTDTGTNTVSYSAATNVLLFDTDLGTNTKAKHWNGFLQVVGQAKATLAQDLRGIPNFSLMAYTLHNDATDAENFTSSARRDDMGMNMTGQLENIKGLPAWATNGISDAGEERCLIGQRGVVSYVIAKAFVTGMPFEAVDAAGKPIGKKIAYGEEYSAIKVPAPLKARLTSVVAYSATNR